MTDWETAMLIGLALGLILGYQISRDSAAKEPVRGGMLAHVFHYLACVTLTSAPVFVISGVILGVGFIWLVLSALGLVGITALFLLVHAAIERQAITPSAAM